MNIQFLYENGKGSVVDEYVRFFKLLFERCLSEAAAAKQLGIHVRTAQKQAEQYKRDPDSIFEKRTKAGRPCILNEEHKKVILECSDENPSVVLDDVMKRLGQVFTELKLSKSTL
ncbi:hypothetical protein RO3G_07058 [Rhizopus delemar RA 99-880]|uniref:Uncharacterized protein n=1 Tax=Rhizopus delemar (strain RA 99-880 / ATCC MYA-4621 / FGSC 9543 / NRRL 43880) TaxID=246409 RepID=I1C1M3_RHIO9|nr:hypothetical protein RO3G_07058 [Rhizopus delemar RA 99-880]|eukprot:EIE82353.1 hypothetical protein RO3G_07058 [Rhizopus delemar RA 99-880]